jgi:hypothetical protein
MGAKAANETVGRSGDCDKLDSMCFT